MWEIDNASQITGFIYSVMLGAVFAAVYDVFRSLRKAVPHSTAAVFIEDILFSVICAFASFCFLLAVTDGGLRLFVFLGAVIGFFLFRVMVSRFTLKIFTFLFTAAVKSMGALGGFAAKINASANTFIIKICGSIKKITKKCKISGKNA